jgi:NDP-sugar pyrophosphorylase family protein
MVMPMAGKGIRTASTHSCPKPLIPINGYPMFYWATKNIIADTKVFIVRQEHLLEYEIDKEINKNFPDAIILVQEGNLDGQLLSILIAEKYVDTEEDVVFVDCDMFSNFDFKDFSMSNNDASILTFENNLDQYSYVIKSDNIVSKIVEKKAISDEAVAGVFYWKSGKTFLKYAKETIDKEIKINGEYYISSVYSEGISDNLLVATVKSRVTYDLSIDSDIQKFAISKEI